MMTPKSKKARASQRKGYRAENEVVNLAKEQGLNVKRTPCSRYPDVEINCRPVSVKRRKNGLKWVYNELMRHDYVLFRADNQPWLRISLWMPGDKERINASRLKNIDRRRRTVEKA